jgi:hypothetical protein
MLKLIVDKLELVLEALVCLFKVTNPQTGLGKLVGIDRHEDRLLLCGGRKAGTDGPRSSGML